MAKGKVEWSRGQKPSPSVTLEQWADAMHLKRRVRRDEANGAIVSTVLLGCSAEEDSHVTLWETLVFGEGHPMDGFKQRYQSLETAVAGHELILQRVREGKHPPKRKFLTGLDSV